MAKGYARVLSGPRLLLALAAILYSITSSIYAAQKDIAGPPGSIAFGTTVTVLPNGNIVVTDPSYRSGRGAAHLYRPNGTRISTLFGNRPGDQVGGGVVVLANGNYVVISNWTNGAATGAGAVTWVDGTRGLSGAVSANNSLVGSSAGDWVGYTGVTALTNGNYVVSSILWSNGTVAHVGASTWGNGATGTVGPVSAENSLVGSTAEDRVGGFYNTTALPNGNYVVPSSSWANGSAMYAGAVTWADGNTGISGPVSATNSLVGTSTYDFIGNSGVAVVGNGNYVVSSPEWHNGAVPQAGAATWADGNVGISGPVSASNSLVGTNQGDYVSQGGLTGVTALTNGNYVVRSPGWNRVGAATWAAGNTGIRGTIAASNSLVGTNLNDSVGSWVVALTNGNYVVGSPGWANGQFNYSSGAATWGDGAVGTVGPVSQFNSLFGTKQNDRVSSYGITALSNGNYVVASPSWGLDPVNYYVGAATWGNGITGVTGPVSAANSLIGTSINDQVSVNGIAALSNGNYVVSSGRWSNGGAVGAGAVTWADGTTGLSGAVSTLNSLVGTAPDDGVGYLETIALSNGNYVAESYPWNNGAAISAGAVSWGNGATGLVGEVSPFNSLVGTTTNALVGYYVTALEDGNYIVASPGWSDNPTTQRGAVTLANGGFRLAGTIQPYNSVIGTPASQASYMSYAYDATRRQLVVGRPGDNVISLLVMDQLFSDGFEP